MNLVEIFTKLPPYVAAALEKHLEAVPVSGQPSRASVLEAAVLAVNRTRDDFNDLTPEVQEILDAVPDASVGHLFGAALEQVSALTTTTTIENPAADQVTTIREIKPL